MADEMTKGNFSGRAGAHVANVTRKWREEARAGSKTGIASEANDRREIFGPKPEKPNKTGIATEALDRREIKGCGLKPGTMRKAMDFIKKGEGQINVDIKPEGPKTVGLIPKPQVSTKKFGPVSYQSTKQPVHTSEGMKQRSTKRLGFDAGPVHAEAHTTSLKSEDVQKVMTFVQNDNPSSPGERAKLLGARAAQAAGVRSQRQMADEDIAEVAQKSIEDKKYSGSGPSHPNRMGGYRPQFGPRVPKYVEGETDQRSGPKVSHVSQMPKCEKSSDSKASPLHSEIAARAFGHTGKNMPIHLVPGTVKKAMDFISKAKGVPSGPGQPPGPPPRPGLQWDAQKHKWLRPEEVSSGQGKVYSGRDAYEEFYDDYYQALKKEVGKTLNKRQLSEADDLITEMAQYSWNEAAGKFNDMKTVSEADAKAAVAECMKDLKDNASTVKDKFGELGDLGDL